MTLNPYSRVSNTVCIPPAGPQGLTTQGSVAAYASPISEADPDPPVPQLEYGVVFQTLDGPASSTYSTHNGTWCPTSGTYKVNYTVGFIIDSESDFTGIRLTLQDTGSNIVRLGGVSGRGSGRPCVSAQAIVTQTGDTCYQVVVEAINSTGGGTIPQKWVTDGTSRLDIWRIA